MPKEPKEPHKLLPTMLICCSVGKAPCACHVEGMGPDSWLYERSTLVMFVKLDAHWLGRQPVRELLFTWKVPNTEEL